MREVLTKKPCAVAKPSIVSWMRKYPYQVCALEFFSGVLLLMGGATIAADYSFRWPWRSVGLGVCMLALCMGRAWRNYNLQKLLLKQIEVTEKQREVIHQLEAEVIKHRDVTTSALVLKKSIEAQSGKIDITPLMQSVNALFSQEKVDLSKLN